MTSMTVAAMLLKMTRRLIDDDLRKKIRFFFLSKSFKNQAVILTTLCQERLLNQKIDNQAIAKKT